MKKATVMQDNISFFIVAVGLSLGTEYFAQAVFASLHEISQLPTDNIGEPGYIRIDTSEISKRGEDFWYEFAEKVKNGFLGSVSFLFDSAINFKGDLLEKVKMQKDGYDFVFEIRQYERDMEHGFKIIEPETI